MEKKLKFTDQAINQINEIAIGGDKKYFRITVQGGGCSGFKYDFSFDQSPKNEDLKFNNIIIDKTSADLLKGSEVDYASDLIGDSFKISNPQSKSSCGCGVSFSL